MPSSLQDRVTGQVSPEAGPTALRSEVTRLDTALHKSDAALHAMSNIVHELRQSLNSSEVAAADATVTHAHALAEQAEALRAALEDLRERTLALSKSEDALDQSRLELAERQRQSHELTQTNAQLVENSQRLNQAIQAADAGSWDWHVGEDRLDWSTECCLLHGIDHGRQLSLNTWLDLIEPDDRQRLERKFRACLDASLPDFRCEYRVRQDGGLRWFLTRGTLIHDGDGKPQRIVGLTIDMTRRKSSEMALAEMNEELNRRVDAEVAARQEAQDSLFQTQKLEALGKLTGGFAHDFNNLLMVISSGLDLMMKSPSEERRRMLVSRIQQATRRGVDNTRRLLAFGRRQELKPERIDLSGRLREFRDLMTTLLEPNIEVEAEDTSGLWPIFADPAALEMALLNLAMNARDAMPGGGRLVLACANRQVDAQQAAKMDLRPGAYVEIAVRDSGTGMPDEVRRRALEPFFTTKGPQQGTGLGLPQVYGFTHQSGGTLVIDSREGEGTTMSLYLPRCDGTADVAERRPDTGANMTTLSILLVEDDDDVGVMVEELLADMGHDVSRVGDAMSAIRALEADPSCQLVFTDVVLPGDWSGLDLAKRIAARRPDLPVVLTTGYTERFDRLGVSPDFPLLRKPYTPESLQHTIEEAFRRRRAAQ